MTRTMRRVTIVGAWTVSLIVVLFAALIAAALIIDVDTYRPAIQRELSQTLGRSVSAEQLSVGVSLRPTIVISGIEVANPPWASRPLFLLAREVSVTLDLIALVRGRIEVGSIALEGVDVLLEQNDAGVGNWFFAHGKKSTNAGDSPAMPNFDAVSLRDVKLGWRDATGAQESVLVDRASAVLHDDEPLAIDATVTYRQIPLGADLKASISLQKMLAGRAVAMTLALRTEAARADLEIALPKPFDIEGLAVDFSVAGKQLDALAPLAGRSLPAWGPYRLSGKAALGGGLVQVSGLRLAVEGLAAEADSPLSQVKINGGEFSFGRGMPTTARFDGQLNGIGLQFKGATAPIDQIVDGAGMIPLRAAVSMGDFALGIEGNVGSSSGAWSADIVTLIRGDANVPVSLLGAPSFRQPLPVDVSARIEVDGDQIAIRDLDGEIAQCALAGEIKMVQGAPPVISGAIRLGQLDVSAFDVEASAKTAQNEPKRQAGAPDWLHSVDLALHLDVEEIIGLPSPIKDVSAHTTLGNGRLAMRGLRASIDDMQMQADAGLQWKGDRPTLDASIKIPVIDIARLTAGNKSAGGGSDKTQAGLDAPLQLAPLRLLDADLQFDIGRIRGAPLSVEGLRGDAQLADGRLRLPGVDVKLAGVPVRATASLDASRKAARLQAKISAGTVDFEKLLDALDVEHSLSGSLARAGATIDTRGTSLRAWIGAAKASLHADDLNMKLPDQEDQLRIERIEIVSDEKVGTRAELRGRYGEFPLELNLTGGKLVELLDLDQAWPALAGELNTMVRQQAVVVTANTALGPLLKGRDVPLRLELKLARSRAVITGTIDDLAKPVRSPFDADVSIESLSHLPLIFSESPLPDLPLSAKGRALVSEDVAALKGLSVRAGQSDLGGDVQIAYGERLRLDADLSSETLDLEPWIPAQTGAAPQEVSTAVADQPVELEFLREFDASVKLSVTRLLAPPVELDQFGLEASLEAGELEFTATTSEGNSAFSMQVDARDEVPVIGVSANTRGLDLDSLKSADAVSARSSAPPRLSGRLELVGAGMTLREIYASSLGYVLAFMGPGRIGEGDSPFVIQAVSADLLTTLVPGKKKANEYNELECAAARFEVKDGVASSPDGIALRFKRVDILGSGAVNLTSREILFGFKAVRRQWFSLSFLDLAGDFAKIGGTLDKPKVGLDTEGVLLKGGAAWATLGVSLLATNFLRKLSSSNDPCAAIVEKGRTAADPIDSLSNTLKESLPTTGVKKN